MVEIKFHQERPIEASYIVQLYKHGGWWPNRQVQDIAKVLNLGLAVGAWDDERLVGFARAVSDGIFRAYIEDVVVHEDYRRSGIGQKLLSKLMNELSDIETVSLFCEPSLVPLYEKTHFKKSNSQVVMHRK
ncbi:GNAT family N-acetyltransferase [Paenibacillus jiagnxiensis]|uniref:GNAT family N-acetyltransferase n=1 Tax=Paenibacillus jiagnxiensis TaxID=3228926 RepID=UPI0033B32634